MLKVENMSNIAIFDLDGTLVDTDAANAAAYDVALRKMGCDGLGEIHGRVSSYIVSKVMRLGENEMNAVIRAKVDAYCRELWRTQLGPASDVFRCVLMNRNAFDKVVLLTNSAERRAQETLRHWSLNGFFDEIVCNGGCGNKYMNYFNNFDSDPARCVVWENEEKQIMSAIVAGVRKNNIRKVA